MVLNIKILKNYKNVMVVIKLWMKKKFCGCDFL